MPHGATHSLQSTSRSCQRASFLTSSKVAMVTEAGGTLLVWPCTDHLSQLICIPGLGQSWCEEHLRWGRHGAETGPWVPTVGAWWGRTASGYRVCECLCVCVHVYVCVCGVDFIACVLWTCTVGNAGEGSGVVLGSSLPPMMYLGGPKLPPGEPSTHHFQKATLCLPRSLLPQTTENPATSS